ncbi:hypothetical protein RRG08_048698 [Elysia crispata]|uniref:Uncharacterized protein n=1 Tax=Elysia crispata TaxID=231223 RepID=A0AAE1A6Q4_9GAST|nr:hypothetical protein RRG08_048698 [Elysia crispata]
MSRWLEGPRAADKFSAPLLRRPRRDPVTHRATHTHTLPRASSRVAATRRSQFPGCVGQENTGHFTVSELKVKRNQPAWV